MRISSPKRGRKTAIRMDVSDLKCVLRDERVWAGRGKVFKPEDAASHVEVDTANGKRRVLVHVEMLPSGQDLTCKLATCTSGPGLGLWFVPKVGTVVRVELADGAIDGCPAIVAVEDTGGFPDRAGTDRVVLISDVPVEVTAPRVTLGPSPEQVQPIPMFGLVHGAGIDPFTRVPFAALNTTTPYVFAKKDG